MEALQPEIIRRYFAKELSDSEALAFEERLQAEPDFRLEVENWAKMHHLADHFMAWKALKQVQEVASAQNPSRKNVRWIGAAAAILLIAIITASIFLIKGNSPEALAQQYVKAYEIELGATLGTPDPAWVDAQNAFQHKDFAAALEKLARFQPQTAYDSAQSYHLGGFANIRLGKFQEAKPLFVACLGIPSDLDSECHWGLALILLAENNPKAAAKELDWILEAQHSSPLPLRTQATELREKIEASWTE